MGGFLAVAAKGIYLAAVAFRPLPLALCFSCPCRVCDNCLMKSLLFLQAAFGSPCLLYPLVHPCIMLFEISSVILICNILYSSWKFVCWLITLFSPLASFIENLLPCFHTELHYLFRLFRCQFITSSSPDWRYHLSPPGLT